jgi:hypothetical protein
LNEAICAGVFGGVALNPEADSMSSFSFALLGQAATAMHRLAAARIRPNAFTTNSVVTS